MSIVNNVRNVFKHIPKKLAATFGVLAAVLIPAAIYAWGPADRPTYTIEQPADHVTFNSITNNPNHGDERNFTSAKLSSEGSSAWRDVINVTGNDEYSVNVYVHNNAAANLGLIAENTRAQVTWNTGFTKQVQLDGVISADNASPKSVWDQVIFKSNDKNFKLVYVAGSAKYYTNANTAGFAIGDNVVKSGGALLGYDSLNGKVPGCFQYTGILNLKVRTVVETNDDFVMEKKVRIDGDSEWSKEVKAKPGQKVNYQISYKNTGDLIHEGVTVRDQLPGGVAYNQNTTTLRNSTYNQGNGMTLNSNSIISTGVNIGSYTPDAAAYTRFTATLPSENELECGVTKLVNKGFVTAGGNTKDDTATVIVEKECPEPEKEFVCDILKINKTGRTDFEFTTGYTIKNTTYKNISYVITGNGVYDTVVSTATDGKLVHKQSKPGTYKVVATLNTVDGSSTTVSCEGEFTVEPEDVPSEAICKVLTADPKAIKTGGTVSFQVYPEYTGNVQVVGSYIDFGDGVKTNVADVYKYSHIYANEGKFNAKAYINFVVDGKNLNDVSSVECEEMVTVSDTDIPPPVVPPKENCTVPGKEHLPVDDPECKSDVVIPGNPSGPSGPSYLPKTGLEVFGILGLGSMATAGAYYISSRRALRS